MKTYRIARHLLNNLRPLRERQTKSSGFSLVELLVVIAIVAVLIGVSIPAVQASRESANKTACANNLRQIGLAFHNHESAHAHFPTGGWGWRWVGDPDKGFGRHQPGGWAFNVLPFLEDNSTRQLASGAGKPAEKRLQTVLLVQTPLSVFTCPSRRDVQLHRHNMGSLGVANMNPPELVAKSDYAVSGGSTPWISLPGPDDAKAASSGYPWPKGELNGACGVRSEVGAQQFVDGLSKTYLVGEKYVPSRGSDSHLWGGDDQTMYIGDDEDVRRFAERRPIPDDASASEADAPVFVVLGADTTPVTSLRFGASHRHGCYMLFGDASVKFTSYDIDRDIHQRQGNRSDGPG